MKNIGRQLFGAKVYEPSELVEKLDRTITSVLNNKEKLIEARNTISQNSLSQTPVTPAATNATNAAQLPKELEKLNLDTTKYLTEVKRVLAKPGENEQQNPAFTSEYIILLIEHIVGRANLIFNMLTALEFVSFESKKEISHIVGALLRRGNDGALVVSGDHGMGVVMKHIYKNPVILDLLVNNYNSDKNDVALNSGQVLRECIKNEDLTLLVLEQHHEKFFDYANLASFDILSDAFSTFRDLMTRHKHVVRKFLEEHYQTFLKNYNERLIESENYVTKRQSIKLLSEVLLDKINFNVMSRYVADVDNLKVIMKLLGDRSAAITLEAFHVFKIFVANPKKTDKVERLLIKNKDKLIHFLTEFRVDQSQDEQFEEERTYLIKQIRQLHHKEVAAPSQTSLPQKSEGVEE